jgi:putative ABC transport system permease protein
MTGIPRPPRLARWLLARALPPDVRDSVTGDLDEFFARRWCGAAGRQRAQLWYWRQTVAFSGHFLAERVRDRRRTTDMTIGLSSMDFKLGLRMLVRYPGLALVGILGMAVGIAIAAGAHSILGTFGNPALPLDEGDRIITIHNRDLDLNRTEGRAAHDFAAWRSALTSVVDVGAYRQIGRNLIMAGAQPETLRIAEMSPSGFRVARVAPLLGRYLVDDDEREAAPAVVVIGAELWRSRFGSDPTIVGRPIQLGAETYTVVGVMPGGFGFPVNHQVWTPLRLNPSRYAQRTGPSLMVFGRLAPGVTLDSAQAELSAAGQRAAAEFPQTHARLRPVILPYTYPFFDIDDPTMAWALRLLQYMMALLLAVVCVNVAILVYARTATRHGEIAVRTALGASRRRIVGQLFVEALVLAAAAAVVGVALTSLGLSQVNAAMLDAFPLVPFWWHFRVSPATVAYVLALAVFAAAIVGVLPALKATGRRVQSGLQQISAGGGSGMQLGKMWTVLIIAQVAVAVALLPAAVYQAWDAMRHGTRDPGFAAHEFLTAGIVLDRTAGTTAASESSEAEYSRRYADRRAELARRLETEAVVSDVTFVLDVPGQEPTVFVEAEGVAMPTEPGDYSLAAGTAVGHMSRFSRVDLSFFDVFDVPVLTGRTFRPGDADRAAAAVVANRSFVQQILGGGHAVGRRIRYVGRGGDTRPDHVELGRWYEIVGVVSDFPNSLDPGSNAAMLYHAAPAAAYPLTLAVRLRGTTPSAFIPRLREIGAGLDPNLQLRNPASLDEALRAEQGMLRLIAIGLGIVTLSVVILSAAGVYALMSFTVARRRREIGIRAALGADPARILRSIFSRAFVQLALGASLGVATAAGLEALTGGELMAGHGAVVLPIVAVVMMIVGLLAAIGPARRGLRIQPTEALREPLT